MVGDAIFLTFDDGYRDNLESACPVLEETEVPGCVFVATGFVGRSNEWSGPEFARRPMLGWEDVVALNARGVSVGGHSVSHARLPDLPHPRVREEVEGCKRELEQRLGISVDAFAYPYGLFSPAVCDAVRGAGYRVAFSTRPGFNRPGDDALLLRRIEVEGSDSCRALARKVRFGTNDGRPRVALRYYADRIRARLGGVA